MRGRYKALLSCAIVPARALLARMADPAFQQSLQTLPAIVLLRECWAGTRMVPSLIQTERLVLGLSTAQVDVDIDAQRESVERGRDLADRIGADPQATELAIQLLTRLAHEGPVVAAEPDAPAVGPAFPPAGGNASAVDVEDDPGDSDV